MLQTEPIGLDLDGRPLRPSGPGYLEFPLWCSRVSQTAWVGAGFLSLRSSALVHPYSCHWKEGTVVGLG